jgi:hypothetical protein
MAYSLQDIGGCACSGCFPCNLPLDDLLLTLTGSGIGSPVTAPLIGPFLVGGYNTWAAACFTAKSVGWAFNLGCNGSCSYAEFLQYTACGGFTIADEYWNSSSGCSGNPDGVLTLGSYTCSPLSVEWTIMLGADTYQLTVTP